VGSAPDAGARLTKAPTVLVAPAPHSPAQARGIAAAVGLMIDLDASGRVTHAEVIEPAGQGFDEAALAAMPDARFTPAEVNGRPSPIRLRFVLHFAPTLGDAAAPDGNHADEVRDAGAADADARPGHGSDRDAGDRDTVDTDARSEATTGAPNPKAPIVLRGRARERGTRAPIPGAQLTVAPRGDNAGTISAGQIAGETDAQGFFAISLPEPAQAHNPGLRITLADANHEPCVRDLDPGDLSAPGSTIEWSCLLPARRGPGYETVVTAAPRNPEIPRHALSQAEARSVPGTMGDPLRAVQSLPGVARAPYGTGMLVVRGASPNDSGVFLDGVQVPLLYHFLVGPSVIPAGLIDQIDFYPGGFGARIGRLSAGAVDVTTRAAPTDRWQGNVEASPLDASLLVSAPVAARTTVTLGARRSLIDQLLPRLVPEKPGTTFATAVPRYWDYQGRIAHEFSNGDRLSLLAFGSDDQLDIVAADPNRRIEFGNHIGFHRVLLSWSTRFAGITSRFEPTYGNGDASFAASRDHGTITYQRLYLREELTRDLGPRLTLALGLDGLLSWDKADFDIVFPREGRTFGVAKAERTVSVRSFFDWTPATWLEARWRVTDWLKVVPGLRVDPYFILNGRRWSADPRLALHFALRPDLGLRMGAGVFQQLPEPRYLDLEFGNVNLSMVRADQYFVGLDHQWSDAIRWSATAFALVRRHIPVPSSERVSSTGRARARGIELLLRHRLAHHFYGWLAYTLSRAEQNADFAEEIESGLASPRGATQDEGAGRSYRRATFDQTHNLVAVASYRRGAWEFGARLRLVSGRPTTPIRSAFADLDFGAFTPERGEPFSTNRPMFSQLDLRIERTFTFDLFQLGLFLDVQNALNAENPEEITYDYRYQQTATVRGLPILPLLGLRGNF
jgi:TonB family protein